MHLELPKARLKSLGDFARHYLMIVLSILTALGLEAWIEHVHHADAAKVASARMDNELHQDLAAIESALATNDITLRKLSTLENLLQADLRAGKTDAAINRDVRANRALFVLNLDFPTLATDAWDVAVANQSAGWIDARTLRRYSAAYSAAQGLMAWTQHDAVVTLNGPRLVDYLTDVQAGLPVVPRDFFHQVSEMAKTVASSQGELRSVRDELRKDLMLPPETGAPPSPRPGNTPKRSPEASAGS